MTTYYPDTSFAEHCHSLYRFASVNEAVIQRACLLTEHHPLRAYDAVHMATALMLNEALLTAGERGMVFLSADDRLLETAAAEGFAVDNPNRHP